MSKVFTGFFEGFLSASKFLATYFSESLWSLVYDLFTLEEQLSRGQKNLENSTIANFSGYIKCEIKCGNEFKKCFYGKFKLRSGLPRSKAFRK